MSRHKREWVVSEYLDDGDFGIVNARNRIVVRIGEGFTREQLEEISATYNRLAGEDNHAE